MQVVVFKLGGEHYVARLEKPDIKNIKKVHVEAIKSQIIDGLLVVLSEKDHVASGHAARVQQLCVNLGQRAGLDLFHLSELSILAKIHDLGKVGIPDEILFKEGPLTENEWEIIKLHPIKGYRIAAAFPALGNVADLILKHHERWDGKGYPLGLKGTGIPIECRILAVVDAFDAMTNDRPYRSAKSTEAALAELVTYAGIQFDPELVMDFLEVWHVNQQAAAPPICTTIFR